MGQLRQSHSAPQYIVLSRPICSRCRKMMRLASIEPHPLSSETEICIYRCDCGSVESRAVDHTD